MTDSTMGPRWGDDGVRPIVRSMIRVRPRIQFEAKGRTGAEREGGARKRVMVSFSSLAHSARMLSACVAFRE